MATDGINTSFEINQPISREEALLFWVEALHLLIDPLRHLPFMSPKLDLKLMALSYAGDDELYTEVNLVDDEPVNILDGTWTAFQIWD